MSASSFAGNRLACVAGIEILRTLEKEKVLEKGEENSALFWAGLEDLPVLHPDIVERITGRGLLIGFHFTNAKKAGQVIRLSISDGLLVAAAFRNSRCLLIEPRLVLEREQGERSIELLKKACRTAAKK